ncbi:hypothetical protein [Hyalangium rubrum]|uniref:Lipoprotein n=1 Tax=Hyalangium rubrum TaxID=3103134 RepID=A0ABU5H818_9BACT|nr:hypothetical protein [Hyalangium sp. s54d21]MDY7229610.1 hypothetical protein [Hyalangium sp. s54d21]
MNLSRKILSVCFALTFFAACGVAEEEQGLELGQQQAAVKAGSATAARGTDNGTSLSATAEVTANTCTSEEAAQVDIAGTVTTTGSVDSVIITASIDGGDRVQMGLIQPQDFLHDGRIKTAGYALSVSLPNGEHTVQVCFTQSGSQGREPKETCAAPITVVVDCAPDNVCEGMEPFGNLVGNPSLCTGRGPPHIPVHVRGDFGESPSLTISGPEGFSYSAAMNHAGESCIYQYNWDAEANGGAGTYTFTVSGNGHTLSFTAELACRSR